MFDNFLKNLRLILVQCATNWQEYLPNKNNFPTLCLAPFKLLPQPVGVLVRDGAGDGVVDDLCRVAVCWTSLRLVERTGLFKRTFFNHTEYVWIESFLNRLRLDFYLCSPTMACSALASSFLVASVPSTSAEYYPVTGNVPSPVDVFPSRRHNLGCAVDVFTDSASGIRSSRDFLPLGSAALSTDVAKHLVAVALDVGPSFRSPRRWARWRCRPWSSRWWRRPQWHSGSLNRRPRRLQNDSTGSSGVRTVSFYQTFIKIFFGRLMSNFLLNVLTIFCRTFNF